LKIPSAELLCVTVLLLTKPFHPMKQKITIDIVSDVVCPWCYIGKRRLESALKVLENDYEFVLEYRPFELNPAIPASGRNQRDYLIEKFGSEERYNSVTQQVTQVAAGEGLEFNFEKQLRSPNTRKAHALIQYAGSEGRQQEVVNLLFKAYFTDGIDLSKDESLLEIADLAGLDFERTRQMLEDENSMLQIALEEQEFYKLGITGVPFFIINKKFGVSGAQSVETFVRALQNIGKEMAPA
jgi:predicted DsbA family dithiol-disulfide isomerase